MNDIQEAVGQINTAPQTVIERAKVDYQTMEEQVEQATRNIDHNDNIIANAQQAISQARLSNKQQREFIRTTKRRQRVIARTTFDLEQINRGL